MSENNATKSIKYEKQILQQLPTPVMSIDTEFNITYMNDAGCSILNATLDEVTGKKCYDMFQSIHCNTDKCCMKKAMTEKTNFSDRNQFQKDGETVHIEYFTAPLFDNNDELVGGVEYIINITERVEAEERMAQQGKMIRELSTPTIKLWEGILVLPVVGIVDSNRAQFMMDSMLDKILETSSKVIILDIHGVAAVDTAVANHLIKITKATKLMGCECLLSGISPAVAQTIIQLGIDMDGINTHSTLSDALYRAYELIKLEVKPIGI